MLVCNPGWNTRRFQHGASYECFRQISVTPHCHKAAQLLFLSQWHNRRLKPAPRKLSTQRYLCNFHQVVVGTSEFHQFRYTHLRILRGQLFGIRCHAEESYQQ